MSEAREMAAGDASSLSGAGLYFPTLDGLRFVAFFLVFLHHLPPSGWAVIESIQKIGWVGVHLFLVLSAFLLTSILDQEHQANGKISIWRFYVRRGLRIWPLYYATCFAVAGVALVKTGWLTGYSIRFAAMLVFLDNVVAGVEGFNPLPFSGHLWTISLEEQFYLLLPWVLARWLGDGRKLTSMLLLLLALNVGVRAVAVALGAKHPMIWTSVFSADALILGTLLAASRVRLARSWSRFIWCVFGLCGLASAGVWPPVQENGWHQLGLYFSVGVGAAALCAVVVSSPAAGFLASRPMRYLGKISYGLYVFHVAAIGVGGRLARVVGGDWIVVAAISFLVVVGVSALSYELFERRFLLAKRRFEIIRTRPA